MYMGNKGGVYDENYALCANDVMIMQTTGNKIDTLSTNVEKYARN